MTNTAEVPIPQTEQVQPWQQYMAYGSERFTGATANNHNIIMLTDTQRVSKLVMGKDAVLVMPENPANLDIWAGYPTHQESWLPMWFVTQYHAQHKTAKERQYREQIAARVTPEDRTLMQRALLHKADEFWQAYKQTPADLPPKKRYKNLTRIAQDILLYMDMPQEVAATQEQYIANHPLAGVIADANRLRKGEGLEHAAAVEQAIEQALGEYKAQHTDASFEEAYQEVQQKIAEASIDEMVALLPDKTLADAKRYAELTSFDLEIAADDHDQDVVSVVSDIAAPEFYQVDTRFGPKLAQERRMDVIAVPASLGVWDTVKEGKDSYQPVSMIVATHTTPKTESGVALQRRLQGEMNPVDVAHHYLGAAEEFLHRHAWGKSFVERINIEGVPQIKKAIPLYRVACDLLPRAVYMLKTGKFPSGISNEELWNIGEMADEAHQIEEVFARQDATEEELYDLFARIQSKFQEWYTEADYALFQKNMQTMQEHKK